MLRPRGSWHNSIIVVRCVLRSEGAIRKVILWKTVRGKILRQKWYITMFPRKLIKIPSDLAGSEIARSKIIWNGIRL